MTEGQYISLVNLQIKYKITVEKLQTKIGESNLIVSIWSFRLWNLRIITMKYGKIKWDSKCKNQSERPLAIYIVMLEQQQRPVV